MSRAGVHGYHAVSCCAEGEETTHAVTADHHGIQVGRGADLFQHRDFFGRSTQYNQGILAVLVNLPQQLRPPLDGPPLIIGIEAPPAFAPRPHAAVVAGLDHDQRPAQPASIPQPRIELDALGLEYVQARAGNRGGRR
jgi:hypothetical protein